LKDNSGHSRDPTLDRGAEMNFEYLPEWKGAHLEDSYLVGIACEECNLRLMMLFAMTIDH
jgi:hypothetical protein